MRTQIRWKGVSDHKVASVVLMTSFFVKMHTRGEGKGSIQCVGSPTFCRTIDVLVDTNVSLVLLFLRISTH